MIQLSKKEQTEMMSLKGQSHYITNVVQVHKSLATAICIEKNPSWPKIKHEELVENVCGVIWVKNASEIIKGPLTVSSSADIHHDLTPHYKKVSNMELSCWYRVVIVWLKAGSEMMQIQLGHSKIIFI